LDRAVERFVTLNSTRIPPVVCWIDKVPAGREADGLIGLADLVPTLARPAGVDGVSDDASGADLSSLVPLPSEDGWLLFDNKTDPYQLRNWLYDPKYAEARVVGDDACAAGTSNGAVFGPRPREHSMEVLPTATHSALTNSTSRVPVS
jgi:hypothetical protein